MTRTVSADLLLDAQAEVGESPRWDVIKQRLIWVDITLGLVHIGDLSAGDTVHDVGAHVGSAMPAADGSLLLARRDGFVRLAEDGTQHELALPLAEHPHLRFNDGACDPAGRAWAGTMPYEAAAGLGVLYRLDDGPTATAVFDGVGLSNGLGWTPGGGRMYFADTGMARVDVCDFDLVTGQATDRRPFVDLAGAVGAPDGLCVDDAGCVWVALWGGGCLHRYTPDGGLDAVVSLPVSQVTSCAFAGPEGDVLVVTSATYRMPEHARRQEPHAGGLFALRPGVTGRPATPWNPVVGAM